MSTYHATKYDSARDEVIAILADESEGFGHFSFGDVESPVGYVQCVTLHWGCDLDFDDHTNYPAGDLAGETAREYGVTAEQVVGHYAVVTNSQGFVTVTPFPSAEALDSWAHDADAEYAAWLGDDDE